MSDPDRPKPLPARPPSGPPPSPSPPPAAATESVSERGEGALGGTPDARHEEIEVTGRGGTWIARVLGRSGRAAARSAPLMLLGFWESGSTAPTPALECTVPARRLADIPEEALQAALARAKAPTMADQRRPFFDEAGPTRLSGAAGEY